jgi:hypothetical protein
VSHYHVVRRPVKGQDRGVAGLITDFDYASVVSRDEAESIIDRSAGVPAVWNVCSCDDTFCTLHGLRQELTV